jgi:hypothetical protein
VLHTFHGDAKVWSNMLENKREISALARNNQVYRLLKPRHLCFLREASSSENQGIRIREVAEWELEHGEDTPLRYLFVAYSGQHFSDKSEADMRALHEIAETAARAARLPAYWLACSCMQNEAESEADVSFSLSLDSKSAS